MKCTNKFDFLVYEMIFIQKLRATLNVQSDSVRLRFLSAFTSFFFVCFYYPFTPANLFILLKYTHVYLPFTWAG